MSRRRRAGRWALPARFHGCYEVRGQLQGNSARLGKVDQSLGALGRQNQQLGTVRSVTDFAEISWQLTARRIEDLKKEKTDLESASDVLQQLSAQEQEMAGRLGRLEDQADKLQRRIGANEEATKEIADAIIEECALPAHRSAVSKTVRSPPVAA